MIRPYPVRNLPEAQAVYSYRLSRARKVIENTFGILASRWSIFRRPIIATPEHVVTYTKAAIALHNLLWKTECTYCPVGFVDSEDNDGNISEGTWREEATAQGLGPISSLGNNRHSAAATSVRDAFKDYFSSPASEVAKSTCSPYGYTVKPPKRRHFGVGPFVLCREVVLSQRFVFKCYRKFDFNRKQGTYLYTLSIHIYSNNNW